MIKGLLTSAVIVILGTSPAWSNGNGLDCTQAVASDDLLRPANHKFVLIEVERVTDEGGGPITIEIDAIFQDEPVEGLGDGDTSPDGAGVGTDTAMVRVERDGGGDGRVYHISFTATDEAGNTCTGKVRVGVPTSRGFANIPVDNGPIFDSTF